jgi:hypothetical protein
MAGIIGICLHIWPCIISLYLIKCYTFISLYPTNQSHYNNLKKKEHLDINLTKEVKDLYHENYKTLKKDIEKDSKRWKDPPPPPCSWIGSINIVKMAIY